MAGTTPLVTVAEQIAEFACGLTYDRLTDSAVHEVKRRLIDSVGCALGGWLSEPAKIARAVASCAAGSPGATVLGTAHRTSPELAAFANGTAIRYLDYNDTYLSREPAHPSDNFAALLAIAEAYDLPGEALILGAVVAYEVQCRLCDAFSIRAKGWDHVTYGAYSTIAGIGSMLLWDPEQMVHALGLAGVPNNAMRQTRVGQLSMWKGCAFANASRNGVFAAQLAQLGMTGPGPVFEGTMGFFNEVCGGERFTLDTWGGVGDEPYMIDRTYIKKYPAEYHSQSAIDAALELVGSIGRRVEPEEIADLRIETFTASWEIIGGEPEKWRPTSRETADHSLPYITCAALVDGKVDAGTFAEARFMDERLLGAVSRTRVEPSTELDQVYPEGGIPNALTLRLADGQELRARVDAPRGHALNPMDDEEVEAKFLQLARPLIRERDLHAALEQMWSLDGLESMGSLMQTHVV